MKSRLYKAFFRDEVRVFVRSCAQVILCKICRFYIQYPTNRYLFKARDKFILRRWSLTNYFVSKTQSILRLYYFSLGQAIKNSSGQMRQPYAYDAYESTRRLVEGGISTGLTNTHTARGFSVLYHVFITLQCILCSALRHKSYLTLLCVTSIRDFFCLGRLYATALLGCCLAPSRLREAASWQLTCWQ